MALPAAQGRRPARTEGDGPRVGATHPLVRARHLGHAPAMRIGHMGALRARPGPDPGPSAADQAAPPRARGPLRGPLVARAHIPLRAERACGAAGECQELHVRGRGAAEAHTCFPWGPRGSLGRDVGVDPAMGSCRRRGHCISYPTAMPGPAGRSRERKTVDPHKIGRAHRPHRWTSCFSSLLISRSKRLARASRALNERTAWALNLVILPGSPFCNEHFK